MSIALLVSHDSALEAHRFAQLRGIEFAKTSSTSIPKRIPPKKSVDRFLESAAVNPDLLSLSSPIHLLSSTDASSRNEALYERHVRAKPLPRQSLLALSDEVSVVSLPLAFIQFACKKDVVDIALKGYELCGSYFVSPQGCTYFDIEPITTVARLQGFARRNKSIPGATRALEALEYVRDGSASPRESALALALCMPMRKGGWGIPFPVMNKEVPCDEEAYRMTGKNSLRCDLCWPQSLLDVEYLSDDHHFKKEDVISDVQRRNALMSLGFTVIDVGNRELSSLELTAAVADIVKKHLGEDRRIRTRNFYRKQCDLRKQLALPLY